MTRWPGWFLGIFDDFRATPSRKVRTLEAFLRGNMMELPGNTFLSFLGLLCHVFRETQKGLDQPGTPKSLGKEAALRKFDYEQNQGAKFWTFLSTWGLVQLFHLRPIFPPRNQIWDRIAAFDRYGMTG
jgi:hypothetical protein